MKKILNKKNIIILIPIILIILLIMVLSKEDVINIKNNDEYIVINNPSNFFTIENCVNKYIRSLYLKNKKDILTLLNKDYVNNHNINENNIFNYISSFNSINTFNTKKIYMKDNKFYVWGYLISETIDGFSYSGDYFVIVAIDKNNNIFDITPYNGQLFKDKGDING